MKKGISVIIGAPYYNGRILGLGDLPPETRRTLARLNAICDSHRVPIRAAALQLAGAHRAVVSVIPGPRSTAEVRDNIRMMQHSIPPEFWDDLCRERLIDPGAPTPQ